MKHNILLFVLALMSSAYILLGNSEGRAFKKSSANTGAPGEASCYSSTCHAAGGIYQTTVAVQLFEEGTLNEITVYEGDQTYDLKVTVQANGPANPNAYGFQLVCIDDANNAMAGNWSEAGPLVHFIHLTSTDRTYAEQSEPASSGVFSMKWTAPAAGTGDITFYAGGNCVNDNGFASGDGANNSNRTYSELGNTSTSALINSVESFSIFPNPTLRFLKFEFTPIKRGDFKALLFNETGSLLKTYDLGQLNTESNNFAYPIDDLSPGFYRLQLITEDAKAVTKAFLKF